MSARGLPGFRAKELRDVLRDAVAEGWTFRHGHGHVVARSPDGRATIVLSMTAYDGRVTLMARAQLRRWKESR